MRTRQKIVVISVALAVAAGSATGIALAAGGNGESPSAHNNARSTGQDAGALVSVKVPYEKASDWVSYADVVAVISVTGERQQEVPDFPGDEGYLNRYITITIGSRLWSRDGAKELPGNLEIGTVGWVYSHGRLQNVPGLGPRLVEGHRYVVAMAAFSDGWGLMAPAMPYDTDRIGDGQACDCQFNEVPTAVWGKQVNTVSTFLAGIKPDPLALKYADLDPAARAKRVIADRRPPN